MKSFTQLFKPRKGARLLLVCLFYFLSINCFADTPYLRMYTSNCSATSNSISFDLYIVNDSNTTVIWYWGQMQFTVDSSIFANYNTSDNCTVGYESGTSDLDYFDVSGAYTKVYSYSASSRTIKLSMKWGGSTAALAEQLLYNTPIRIGRFTLTNNTENFVSNASVNLNWNVYSSGGGYADLLFYFPSSSSTVLQLKQIDFTTDSAQKGYLSTPCSISIPSACTAPALSSSITNISCNGKTDGAIDLATSGGTSPFTYSWTKDGDASFSASSEDISGLSAGKYNVTVSTTGDTCSATASYTITEPAALDTITTTVSACDSYIWDVNNTTYTSSGIYDTTIGCQPYKLSLTITGSTNDTTTTSACGSYTWSANGVTYTSGGTYSCVNGCKNSVLNLTIYNSVPGRPETISGKRFDLCNVSEDFTYTAAEATEAASYMWKAPEGTTITSGNGTNIIALNIPSGFLKGKLKVTAVNSCGNSIPRRIMLRARPPKPIISGPACASANETGLTYTVTNATAGVTYTWHVPGIAKITSGQGTSTVTVTWRGSSGVITCIPSNACAAGAKGNYTVTVGCASATAAQTAKNIQLQAYPNPSQGLITVIFSSDKGTKYKLVITDITGRQVISKEITASAGSNKVNADISKYANGIYMLSLISDKGVQTIKVVKQ